MADSLAFDSILNFISDLVDAFPGSTAESYYSKLKEIKVCDKQEQEKHVKLFSAFCIANREEIMAKKLEEFQLHKLVFDDAEDPFDIQEIFDHKDFKENEPDILRHLLTISAIVDKESMAKQILVSMNNSNLFKDSSITDLFGEITRDVEAQAGGGSVDPLKTIECVIKADPFKKLVSTIMQKTQSGEVDLNNLITGMGSIGKLMDGLGIPKQ
jgi:hypothetical protein